MIHVQSIPLPPVNRREVLRYALCREETQETARLLDAALEEAEPVLRGIVCWREFPLTHHDKELDLTFARVRSAALQQNLQGCERIILFAATVGLGLDRLIHRYSRIAPAHALLLQAIGAERIEAVCDVFCRQQELKAEAAGLHTRPRFSPGYGDFPLELQSDIFRVLDCSGKIGLTLNESLLMSPTKSVTAVIGLGVCPGKNLLTGCHSCSKPDCIYRRTQ